MAFEFPPMKPKRFLFWNWTSLRSLGNSPAVRLSAVFPFVGYFIIFNDQVSHYLKMTVLEAAPSSRGSLDVLWDLKLYILYFGLLLLGLGSFIYQARCPYIIKKHADWSSYVIGDGDAMSDSQILSLAKVLGAKIDDAGRTPNRDSVRVYVMQRWFAEQSNENPLSRLMVGLLIWIGLALVAIPSILSATKIFGLLLQRA